MSLRIAPLAALALLALGATNAWLSAVVVEEMFAPDDLPADKVDWSPTLSASAKDPPGVRPIADYAATLAHPIFARSRAPFVAPPPPPPPIAAAAPNPVTVRVDPGLALGGVVISSGILKAYLFRKSDPSGTWVAQGEEFMGWKLVSVDAGGIKLQQGERTVELQLYAGP